MSEQTIAPATPPASAPVAPQTPAPTAPVTPPAEDVSTLPQWARDAITKANSEAAAARIKAKELEPAAAQFAALEEASKTEAQRLAESEATAKREAQEARAESTRYKVALAHGIPVDDFDLLGTGTEEEITARAVKLAAKNAAQAAAAAVIPPVTPPGTRPVEALRPGATPSEAQTTDDAVMARLFPAGY